MLPDRVLNPGPLTYESGALPIALRDLATVQVHTVEQYRCKYYLKTIDSYRHYYCFIWIYVVCKFKLFHLDALIKCSIYHDSAANVT